MPSNAWSREAFLTALPGSGLPATQRLLLKILASAADSEGVVDYPVGDLAEQLSVTRRQASRLLADLEALFYIERFDSGGGVGALFRITATLSPQDRDAVYGTSPQDRDAVYGTFETQFMGQQPSEARPETASHSREDEAARGVARNSKMRGDETPSIAPTPKRFRGGHTRGHVHPEKRSHLNVNYKSSNTLSSATTTSVRGGHDGLSPRDRAVTVPAPEQLDEEARAVLIVRGRRRGLGEAAMRHAEEMVLTWGRAHGVELPNWTEAVWQGVIRGGWALEGFETPSSGAAKRRPTSATRRGRVSGRRIMSHDDDGGDDDGRGREPGADAGPGDVARDDEW